jgi:hypothetical protein
MSLLELSSWRATRKGGGYAAVSYVRPAVESLEDRTATSCTSPWVRSTSTCWAWR